MEATKKVTDVRREAPLPETVEELEQLLRRLADGAVQAVVHDGYTGWRAGERGRPAGEVFDQDPKATTLGAVIDFGLCTWRAALNNLDLIRGESDAPDPTPQAAGTLRRTPTLSLEGLRKHLPRRDVEGLIKIMQLGGRTAFGPKTGRDLARQVGLMADASEENAEAFVQELGYDLDAPIPNPYRAAEVNHA